MMDGKEDNFPKTIRTQTFESVFCFLFFAGGLYAVWQHYFITSIILIIALYLRTNYDDGYFKAYCLQHLQPSWLC